MDPSAFLSLVEAASHTRLHHNTIRRACLSGELPHRRVFRKILIRREDLEGWLSRLDETARPAATR